MRGIPPPAVSMLALARLFSCPARGSGHWSSPRDGGYMRRAMAVPERQPSLHEGLKEIEMLIFQARLAYMESLGLQKQMLWRARAGEQKAVDEMRATDDYPREPARGG